MTPKFHPGRRNVNQSPTEMVKKALWPLCLFAVIALVVLIVCGTLAFIFGRERALVASRVGWSVTENFAVDIIHSSESICRWLSQCTRKRCILRTRGYGGTACH